MYRFLSLLFILCVLSVGTLSAEPSWPRFRGPNGSGLGSGGAVTTAFQKENSLWKVEVPGIGHGSPVIFGDRLFVLSAVAAEVGETPAKGKKAGKKAVPYQWLALCLDRETGETLWSKNFDQGKFKGHRFNSPATSTPAVDAERVVFAWGTAEKLTVVSMSHDGEVQWESDLGPVVGGHGFGGSPMLHDGLVVINNDQEKQNGNLFALHAESGEVAWEVERRSERISYSVPCVYEAEGRDLFVFTNWQHGFTAIDPADGSVVDEKSVFYLETNERAISSPVVTQGMVIGTCGFTANPKHCVAMAMKDGKWEEIWRIERSVPHIPSVIAVGDYCYLIDDSGIATCVEITTGKQIWMKRLPGIEGPVMGSPVSDGVNIFFADESGNLHVLAASPEFTPVSSTRLGELCRSTPAIVDGTIYVRTEKTLHAFR
ncbi:MAG: PQQ-binding-like beta-propeller repeat protein [Verrucomicrobiales bacterium]|nr:PQQ-binding-like beta-propeller repeat protein [Verrucomicrobiales bacterium]